MLERKLINKTFDVKSIIIDIPAWDEDSSKEGYFKLGGKGYHCMIRGLGWRGNGVERILSSTGLI